MKRLLLLIVTTFSLLFSCTTNIPFISNIDDTITSPEGCSFNYNFVSDVSDKALMLLDDSGKPIENVYPYKYNESESINNMIAQYLDGNNSDGYDAIPLNIELKKFDLYLLNNYSDGELIAKAFVGGDLSSVVKTVITIKVSVKIGESDYHTIITTSADKLHNSHMSSSMNGSLLFNIESAVNKDVPIEQDFAVVINQANNKAIKAIDKFLKSKLQPPTPL